MSTEKFIWATIITVYFSVCAVWNCLWMQLDNIDSRDGEYANDTMIFFHLTSCVGKSRDGRWSGAVKSYWAIYFSNAKYSKAKLVGCLFSQFRRLSGWLHGWGMQVCIFSRRIWCVSYASLAILSPVSRLNTVSVSALHFHVIMLVCLFFCYLLNR